MVFFRSTGTPVIVAMPRGVPRFPRGEGRPDTPPCGAAARLRRAFAESLAPIPV
jgi:hypothetical protein